MVLRVGIANFGYHAFADRFTYIPAIGLSIAAMGLFARRGENSRMRALLVGGAALWISVMAVLTWRQTGFWENDKKVWTHTLSVDGEDSAVAHCALAIYLFEYEHDDLEEVVRHFKRAKELDSSFLQDPAHLYMTALCDLGRRKEAKELLDWVSSVSLSLNDQRKAILGPNTLDFKSATFRFSRIMYFLTDPKMIDLAEEELAPSIKHSPDNRNVIYLQGRIALARGKKDEAAKHFRRLREVGHPEEYIQYRFLEKEYSVDRNKSKEG